MNILRVAATGLRNLMLADLQLAERVKLNNQYKIIRGAPTGVFPPPYISMVKLYGGEENVNASRSFDMIFRIAALSPDQVEAEELYTLIENALVGKYPTLQDGWEAWAGITQGTPFHDSTLVQNKPYDVEGAQFRIRAVKDKT